MARRTQGFDFRSKDGDKGIEGEARTGDPANEVVSGVGGTPEETGPAIFDPAAFRATDATDAANTPDAADAPADPPNWFGRRRGGKKGPRKAAKAENLEALLLSIHGMLAAFTSVEELELAEEESKKLAEAIARVQKLYDYKWISDEAAAWGNLIIAAGGIYGPRYMAIRLRQKREKEEERFNNARHVASSPTG